MPDREPLVVVEELTKVFGRRPRRALDLLAQGQGKDAIFAATGMTVGVQDASFEVYPGEVFVIMGLSGSGKSTVLRMLNRLIEPTAGRVRIGGRDVTAMSEAELIALRRADVSMVFQSFALMPHLTVWENVAFGLDVAGIPKAERREQAERTLAQVGLAPHAESYPAELSGGMQQRVGLARALAADPKLLLMDEAFSALDPLIRAEMQDELVALQREQERTVVFISHDLDEAMRIGDRIAIMEGGRIVQIGTPEEILERPADDFVRSFFRGVDVTKVYEVGQVARLDRDALVAWRSEGLRHALLQLETRDREFGYVRGADGRFLGVVSVESLLAGRRRGANDLAEAYLDVAPLAATTPLAEAIRPVRERPCPLPVVDGDGRLTGTLSRALLLEVIEREPEGEPTAAREEEA